MVASAHLTPPLLRALGSLETIIHGAHAGSCASCARACGPTLRFSFLFIYSDISDEHPAKLFMLAPRYLCYPSTLFIGPGVVYLPTSISTRRYPPPYPSGFVLLFFYFFGLVDVPGLDVVRKIQSLIVVRYFIYIGIMHVPSSLLCDCDSGHPDILALFSKFSDLSGPRPVLVGTTLLPN